MKKFFFQLTLNKIFLLILSAGFVCLFVIGYVLLDAERENALKKWQMNTIQISSSATSSYYSGLIRGIVLGSSKDITDILKIAESGEHLRSIGIVPQTQITPFILETCEVDKGQSFFHQVPTCIEYKGHSLFVFHELRSTGYNLGYLRKEVSVPEFGLFDNEHIFRGFALVMICFLLINTLMLFVLKRLFMYPIRKIIDSLSHDRHRLSEVADRAGIREIQQMAAAMNGAFTSIEKYQSEAKQLEYEAKLGKMTSQVAHDIRSPLAALNVATSLITGLEEDNRLLIRRAVQRIDDIANELIGRSKATKDNQLQNHDGEIGTHLLSGLIEPLVSEKRLQFRTKINVDIDFQIKTANYGLFGKIDPFNFKRILSNIINNSVEALQNDEGRVEIRLSSENANILIEIEDNGAGILEENIPKLMQKGATFGKDNGLGLGLFHANELVSSWGGQISIRSEFGAGTTVSISIPRVPEPDWFVQELIVPSGSDIVILDDDDSIHEIWKGRFNRADLASLNVQHFRNPFDAINWHATHGATGKRVIYLFDHELIGYDLTGLDVIKKLNICRDAILVTSRFDEESIRDACISLHIKMIPKSSAGFVPIHLGAEISPGGETEYVLIDDCAMTRRIWEMAARSAGRKIVTFSHPADFFRDAEVINKKTPIFIDANLSDGLKGGIVSREIHSRGFCNIHISTGDDAADYRGIAWIKSVIDKRPPFLLRKGL